MKKVNDIVNVNKTYAREKFREWFYVFDTLKECNDYIDMERLTPYSFYDGIHIYTQKEVENICFLRENGKEKEIRY